MRKSFGSSLSRIVFLFIACTAVITLQGNAVIYAQQKDHQAPAKQPKPDDFANTPYADLLNRLEGLKPEYQAVILLELGNTGHKGIPDDKFTRALLHLFDSAQQTRYESELIYAANSQTDSLSSHTAAILPIMYITGSRLGMQSAIVRILRRDNPQLAASKFASIVLPNKTASCSDAVVENFRAYYETFRDLYNDDRVKQIDGMQKSIYLEQLIRSANSIERITSLAQIFPELKVLPETLQSMSMQLVSQLNSIEASDREMNALGLPLVENLNKLMNQGNLSNAKNLALLRQFLVVNLQAGACSDVAAPRDKLVDEFNKAIPQGSETSPLQLADVKPKSENGMANDEMIQNYHEVDSYWDDLVEQTRQRSNAGTFPNGDPDPVKLNADVETVIRAMHKPPSDTSCGVCTFAGAAAKYQYMINSLPPGPQLEYAIQEFITMLEQNPVEDENPPSYAIRIWWLMEYTRPMSKEMRERVLALEKQGVYASIFNQCLEKEYLRKRMMQSPDHVINTFMFYDELYKPEFDVQ